MYADMLDIIEHRQVEHLFQLLRACDCFSIQTDKSVDKYNVDSLYVTVRYMLPEDFQMKVGFIGACHSDLHGVAGLVDALDQLFTDLGVKDLCKQKLVGLTTDGESANTGRHGGLWVKLAEYLGHGLLTIWCVGHRSDLAPESVSNVVPAFRHWKADLKSVGAFYRASAERFSDLKALGAKHGATVYSFPRHHDVRFAEHLENLVTAVVRNHPFTTEHWTSIADDKDIRKAERQQATGFLKVWGSSSFNMKHERSHAGCSAPVPEYSKGSTR